MSEDGNMKNREPLAITTAVVAAVGGLINVAVLFGWMMTSCGRRCAGHGWRSCGRSVNAKKGMTDVS